MASKFTPEAENKVLDAIRSGANQKHAAIAGGVSYGSLRERLRRGRKAKNGKDKEFLFKFEAACKDADQIWVDRVRRGDQEIRVMYDAQGKEISRTVIVRQRASDALRWLQVHRPYLYDKTFSDEELIERFTERYGPKWAEFLEELIDAAERSVDEV